MSNNEMSAYDAFVALSQIDDEDIVIPASRHDKLKEGKSFDVRDDHAMNAAVKFNEPKSKEDVVLEVVDSNADSEEHLRNNSSYVGQRILQCDSCHTNRFVNLEDLDKQPDGSYKVKDNVNTGISNECPHCHSSDVTYKSIGDVAAVEEPKEPEPEAQMDNDQANNQEATFDNDMTSTEQEGEPATPTENPEENAAPEASAEEPAEQAYDQTSAEDDTADMQSTTGDEYDADDVKADDTETFPWDDDNTPSEEEKVEDDLLFKSDEEKKEKKKTISDLFPEEDSEKKESLEESIMTNDTLGDLLNNIIEPDNIDKLDVLDADGETIYSGDCVYGEDVKYPWLDSDILSWGVLEGRLILNVSEGEGYTLDTVLSALDDETDKIDIYDVDSDEEIDSGLTKEEVLEKYGDWTLESIEAPERLSVSIDYTGEEDADEYRPDDDEEPELASDDNEAGQWYESLSEKVCAANGLKPYRINKAGTQEYYINESIKEKEDLDIIYEHFLKNIVNESVMNEFKEATGYKTRLDEAFDEQLVEGFYSEPANEEEATKWAQEISRKENCDVVYGYKRSGEFWKIKEPYKCRTADDLKAANADVRCRFKPTGNVYTWYKTNNDTDLDESKNVQHFESRKDLADAIQECKNNNQPYVVKKSMTEGYRYDLITEAKVDESAEDYEESADEWINKISEMSAKDVDTWLKKYDFDNLAPADEQEQKVWDALKARKAELEGTDECLTEDNEVALRDNSFIPATVHRPEAVESLVRITNDIWGALKTAWGYNADKKAIANDLINDLEVLKNQEDDNQYRELISKLDSKYFQKDAILNRLGSQSFMQAVLAGQCPFMPSRALSGQGAARAKRLAQKHNAQIGMNK